MTLSDMPVEISGTFDVLAAVDERQRVLVQRVQHELDADERQDQRQPVGQVHQPVQQAADRKYSCRRPISAKALAVKTM